MVHEAPTRRSPLAARRPHAAPVSHPCASSTSTPQRIAEAAPATPHASALLPRSPRRCSPCVPVRPRASRTPCSLPEPTWNAALKWCRRVAGPGQRQSSAAPSLFCETRRSPLECGCMGFEAPWSPFKKMSSV